MAQVLTTRKSLRIAFFVGTFPVISETFIVRQIEALLASGHTVHIFADTRAAASTPDDGSTALIAQHTTWMDMPSEAAPFEMPVFPITGRTWPPGASTSVLNVARLARALPRFARCFSASPRLALQMINKDEYGYRARSLSQIYRMSTLLRRGGNYDIAHAHFGPVANSFRFVREMWRAPFVVSFHGYDFTTVPRKEGKGVYKNLFAAADAVTGNSEFTVRRLIELGCPKKKVRRLPMGLDPQRIHFRERTLARGEPVRILVVARLILIKGVAYAIEAVSKLRSHHPHVRLDIVGDGPSRVELEQQARKLGLENVVHFHGALSGNELETLRDAAHIFLHLSVTVDGDQEGQGVVLQEAQAAGLPVIATRHGAFPEGVIHGKSALLVPERDASAAAEALDFLIQNADTWPEMGHQGRMFVEANYDIRRLNDELVKLYRETIEDFAAA